MWKSRKIGRGAKGWTKEAQALNPSPSSIVKRVKVRWAEPQQSKDAEGRICRTRLHEGERRGGFELLDRFQCQRSHNSPTLPLPKNRPDFVDEDGGGGF